MSRLSGLRSTATEEGTGSDPVPCLVVTGDRDQYCGLADLDAWLELQPGAADKLVLPGVDHFYRGAEAELSDELATFWER